MEPYVKFDAPSIYGRRNDRSRFGDIIMSDIFIPSEFNPEITF